MRNYIVLDTETAPITSLKLDNVEPSIMRVYDIGWCVVDGNTGAILEKRSYVVSEVFYNAALMKSAYYAESCLFIMRVFSRVSGKSQVS